jgi:hypothetical protein
MSPYWSLRPPVDMVDMDGFLVAIRIRVNRCELLQFVPDADDQIGFIEGEVLVSVSHEADHVQSIRVPVGDDTFSHEGRGIGKIQLLGKARRCLGFPPRATPCPARTIGLFASRINLTAAANWRGSGPGAWRGLAVNGCERLGTAAPLTSSGIAMYTATGLCVCANSKAFGVISGAAAGVTIVSAHFVTGLNIETRSTIWCDSLQSRLRPT